MPSWILKATVQRAIGVLPCPHLWNGVLQSGLRGRAGFTPSFFLERLDVARRHLDPLIAARRGLPQEWQALELGTGWLPVVPIALWLCGARRITTYDLRRHVTAKRLALVLDAFVGAGRTGALQARLPRAADDRLAHLSLLADTATRLDPRATLREIDIDYVVGDVLAAPPAMTADLVMSHAVLEYLQAPLLAAILAALRGAARPDGVASHWIDFSDEYAYFDKRLSPLNFLRYSEARWRAINNPLIPLSRLRIDDVRAAFARTGWTIVEESCARLDPGAFRALALAPEFQGRDRDDLRTLSAWLVARPAPVSVPAAIAAGEPALATR